MIKEQEFKDIIEKSKRFSNSSMYYIGYDEVKEYSILINNEDMPVVFEEFEVLEIFK